MKKMKEKKQDMLLLHILCRLLLMHGFGYVFASVSNPDIFPLLEFKASLEEPSRSYLSSWSYSSDPCASGSSWVGVTCHNNRVTRLVLQNLNLTGPITPLTRGLDQLRLLSLHHNRLSSSRGSSLDLSSCTNLKLLFLSFNRLSGAFPSGISSLRRLRRIDLSHNQFSGGIPTAELSRLPRLATLRLEENSFTGNLSGLYLPPAVSDFNISDNQFVGRIPESFSIFPFSSFAGNENLCGRPLLTNCSSKMIKNDPLPISVQSNHTQHRFGRNIMLVIIILGNIIAVFLVLIAAYLYCSCHRKEEALVEKRNKQNRREKKQGQWDEYWVAEKRPKQGREAMVLFEGCEGFQRVEDLLRASAEMLGRGTVGTTYKAALEGGGKVVVVKRVRDKRSCKEVGQVLRDINRLRHHNVVALRAYYCSRDELLLISDFLPAGSLHFLLHGNRGPGRTPLAWGVRLKLADGAAKGLAFLHEKRLAHGHVTSANILVGGDGEARVSDFGLHQLLPHHHKCHAAASQKADVYGFGVVLLELLTGKSAGGGDGEAARWVGRPAARAAEAFDLELMVGSKEVEDEMVGMLQVALLCLAHRAQDRPRMSVVSKMVEDILVRGGPKSSSASTQNLSPSDSSPALSEDNPTGLV